ncbi:hypothetical protein F5Y16DRAFT_383703 [Xylariaceae sp. FL0255]|nr:hypothetical protein F5Y16DRAFT_383703 [Xylariaceae sp. FL0255]
MASSLTTAANDYGRRLLPHIIDDIASNDPQREAFMSPRSSNPDDGWEITTYAAYTNAINRCAWDIINKYGGPPKDQFPAIAYIGPQDARYLVIVAAAMKAGYQALLISTRNTQEAQINLFEKTNCSILWHSENLAPLVKPWLVQREMRTLVVKSLEEWFPTEKVPHFPYDKTFEEGQYEPFCILHTSGSTGLPKPIFQKQGLCAFPDAWRNLPPLDGTQFFLLDWSRRTKRFYSPMPLFHGAGIGLFFCASILYSTTLVLPFPDRVPTADSVLKSLANIEVECALLPPSILEELSQDPSAVATLSKMDSIIFGGSHLVKEAGERLVRNNVRLINLLAASEYGFLPMFHIESPEDWAYFKIDSEEFGADWRPSHDGSFELVIVRKEGDPPPQAIFYTFPELREFSTNDLYKPHPTRPHHWSYYGRADNIIVFSNGEKLNPVSLESIVEGQPEVKGALVFGSNRFQAGLLLEPTQPLTNETEKQEFINRIWPVVDQANRDTVAHGRIAKELISVTNPEKPFPRAGKGTIQRGSAIKLYSEELDNLYEQAEKGSQLDVGAIDLSSEESVSSFVMSVFGSLARGAALDPDTDFFSAGVDSLQVMNVSRVLRSSLTKAVPTLDSKLLGPRAIYNNPTTNQLARYLIGLVSQGATNGSISEDAADSAMAKTLYEKYTRDLATGKRGRPEAPTDKQTILLTGSTGHLGVYLLDQLVHNPAVSRVICLNRAENGGAEKQQKQMEDRGLTQDASYVEKVEYLQVDLSKEKFGLSDEKYERLRKEAHRFIHNAWPVNFNFSMESFEPSIRGVRRLADFAAQADHRVAVVFVSSIGSVMGWDTNQGPVPELRFEDWSLALGSYSRSKMCASLILEDAAKADAGDFPAASIRVGQIAGPETDKGLWNRHEWLPSIVASSLYLGALPRELGSSERVDWVPVEHVARLVLDIVGATPGPGRTDDAAKEISGYYHCVNASATSWKELAPTMQQFYGNNRIKELVSFEEWVDRLGKSDAKDIDSNPGLKLLDTYRGWTMAHTGSQPPPPFVLDLKRTYGRSPAMLKAPVISPELLIKWCKQWAFA